MPHKCLMVLLFESHRVFEDVGGDGWQRPRPELELVIAEVARVFEDTDELDIDDFMEGEAISSYDRADIEDALKAIAAMVPPKLIIDDGEYPPYRRPPV